jgi:hypothetical protein
MEPELMFTSSAFKHGVSAVDISHALRDACYDGPVEGEDNKYLCVGFDTSGNPLEVLYNEVSGNRLNVFHAMKCQKRHLNLIINRKDTWTKTL